MIPERDNPQDGSGWTKIDEGWRQGVSRTLIGSTGILREENFFLEDNGEHIQQDIHPNGFLVRTISREGILIPSQNLGDISSLSFAEQPKERIKIIENNTGTSLTVLSLPNEGGESNKERRVSFKRRVLDAVDSVSYFDLGRFCTIDASVYYDKNSDINSILINSVVDKPADGGHIVVYEEEGSLLPTITLSLKGNDQRFETGDELRGWLSRGKITFLSSGNKKVSEPFGCYPLVCRVEDTDDRFVLEIEDTTTKKTIRISAVKKVDLDGLFSIASIPEFTGWEIALQDVDKYFTVEKSL